MFGDLLGAVKIGLHLQGYYRAGVEIGRELVDQTDTIEDAMLTSEETIERIASDVGKIVNYEEEQIYLFNGVDDGMNERYQEIQDAEAEEQKPLWRRVFGFGF